VNSRVGLKNELGSVPEKNTFTSFCTPRMGDWKLEWTNRGEKLPSPTAVNDSQEKVVSIIAYYRRSGVS